MSKESILRHWSKAAADLSPVPPTAGRMINHAPTTPFGTGGNGITSNGTFSPRQLLQMRPYERREALKTSRWLDNNLALVGTVNDKSAEYAIGNGVNDYAATGDPEYDQSCDLFTKSILESSNFDLAGEQCFAELQYVAARAMIVDGDMGAAHILSKGGNGEIIGGPQVQLFASDQIDSTPTAGLVDDGGWIEGVKRNAFGRALAYRVQKGDQRNLAANGGTWDYPARDFMLILDRKRIHLSRGMPWCHRASRNGQSMITTGALVEAAEHINALFAAIITTPTGETPEALESFIVDKFRNTGTETPEGTIEQKQVMQRYVEIMGGGKVPVFDAGTEMKAYNANRQSQVYNGHMDYLANMICNSYGMPVKFIWAMTGARHGPDVRMTLAQAGWYFNRIMMIVLRRFIMPVREQVVKVGILTGQINGGRLPRNGASPYLATYHGPRDITIDERYYHKTWLDRLADGKGTEEEYFSLQGQNAETVALKRIKEIARRKEWCKQYGVEYHGEYVRSAPGTVVAPANQNPGDGNEPDPQE